MDQGENDGAMSVWEFDTAQVEQIWLDTREVFGNKLWVEGMLYGVFPEEWQEEAEERSGTDFFDVLVSAVQGYDEGDPSGIFVSFRREFAEYGISTVFAPHPRHGDVLERARRIAAGEPLPGPAPCHLDETAVAGIWDALAHGFAHCGSDVTRWFPEETLDDFELAADERMFTYISGVLDGLAPDDDRSLVFPGLRDLAAGYGIALTFAPHPRFGDLIGRADRLRAGEPVPGPGPWHLDGPTVAELWRRIADPGSYLPSVLNEALPADLVEAIEEVTGRWASHTMTQLTDDLTEDGDPSLLLAALQRTCARRGLVVAYAPHLEHGDVIARARELTAAKS
ncbi:hypothetical protein [Kitasatospora sp. KL5]|uniref:hypothetical protein n=1 Tax=Kitasatospora sp. KL5 TaxID=3425125 RepID=UPI003D70207F